MQKPHPRSLRFLMHRRTGLNALRAEARRQDDLLRSIRGMLPAAMADQVVAARISANQLIIHTNSPVLATRLRYLSPQILSGVRVQHPVVGGVKTRLLQPEVPVARPARKRNLPTKAVRIILESAAKTNTGPVGPALERLAATLERRSRQDDGKEDQET